MENILDHWDIFGQGQNVDYNVLQSWQEDVDICNNLSDDDHQPYILISKDYIYLRWDIYVAFLLQDNRRQLMKYRHEKIPSLIS
jgi:hypothetical protein